MLMFVAPAKRPAEQPGALLPVQRRRRGEGVLLPVVAAAAVLHPGRGRQHADLAPHTDCGQGYSGQY